MKEFPLQIIGFSIMTALLITIGLQNKLIIKKQRRIMSTQAELRAELESLTAQNEKAKGEILGKIADLEAAIENAGNTTPEVDAALTALKTSVQGTDDIVPDAAPEA